MNIFPSDYDMNISILEKSIKYHTISLISRNNEYFMNIFGKNVMSYDGSDNFIDVIREILRLDKDTKNKIRLHQLEAKNTDHKQNLFGVFVGIFA